jgi:hypothetical protein
VFDFELEFLTVVFCFRPRRVAVPIFVTERINAQKAKRHSDQENNVLHGTECSSDEPGRRRDNVVFLDG